jgi:hypothetical protein
MHSGVYVRRLLRTDRNHTLPRFATRSRQDVQELVAYESACGSFAGGASASVHRLLRRHERAIGWDARAAMVGRGTRD